MATRRKKAAKTPPPGTFRPAVPSDSDAILRLFAIGARIVAADHSQLGIVTQTMRVATINLVPPEKMAADECDRLWQLFAKVGGTPKDSLRDRAATAFYRDLDSLGQRMDLAPLPKWAELPNYLEEKNPVQVGGAEPLDEGSTLAEIRVVARQRAKKKEKGPPLEAKAVLKLLTELTAEERESALKGCVGDGTIGRGDAGLITRVIGTSGGIGKDDEMLIEVLETLGTWLVEKGAR